MRWHDRTSDPPWWEEWHDKFAWWPTRVEGFKVWLEFYERRGTVDSMGNIDWERRLLAPGLAEPL